MAELAAGAPRRWRAGTAGYPEGLSDEELAFQRLYGPWDAYTPETAAEMFGPVGVEWWVAGGWAIQAFTGVERHHEDIDVAMFRRDLGRLRDVLAGRFHVWAAHSGSLTPLAGPDDRLPDGAGQVWIREHALAPWRADVLLTADEDGLWVSKRDRSHVAPLTDVTWTRDGVRYLRPEIALAYKAKHTRPKDERDFETTLPLLDPGARDWLADFLRRIHPDHLWLQALDD